LLLIRHSKTEPNSASGRDEDRRLLPRGVRDAEHIAKKVLSGLPRPDVILASTAKRVRETFETIRTTIPGLPEAQFLDELYLADAGEVWQILFPWLENNDRLWVIGHNPGLLALVGILTGTYPESFPTTGVARIELSAQTSHTGSAKLTAFHAPRDFR